jgi:hypothetical protein
VSSQNFLLNYSALKPVTSCYMSLRFVRGKGRFETFNSNARPLPSGQFQYCTTCTSCPEFLLLHVQAIFLEMAASFLGALYSRGYMFIFILLACYSSEELEFSARSGILFELASKRVPGAQNVDIS